MTDTTLTGAWQQNSFNSLLEMQICHEDRGGGNIHDYCFNSLLEMHNKSLVPPQVGGAVGFQFSIGDAPRRRDGDPRASTPCFNSLLEMPRAAETGDVACVNALCFNSLLEMRDVYSARRSQ